MEGLRVVTGKGLAPLVPCSRCRAAGCPWDRVAGKAICPDCQEQLALGEGEPLVEALARRPCAACGQAGTICYLTFPLHAAGAVEIDLCPGHFRDMLKRRLDYHAFHQLGRQLLALGLNAQQVFLLHDAFYDDQGRPLQPVLDAY